MDEAHKWGRTVAAHAIGPFGHRARCERRRRFGRARLHAHDGGGRLMKERGTFLVPTISAIRGMVEHPDEVPA
ncbi:MAG: hypothetical protein ACRDH0_07755 [Actinomycetota bacterium]